MIVRRTGAWATFAMGMVVVVYKTRRLAFLGE